MNNVILSAIDICENSAITYIQMCRIDNAENEYFDEKSKSDLLWYHKVRSKIGPNQMSMDIS